jgi:tagaturonate reductase
MAEKFYTLWNKKPADRVVKDVLKDLSYWGHDLSRLPGFQDCVTENLNSIINNGMKKTLERALSNKKIA